MESVGARQTPVAIVGMENYQEFREVILEGQRSSMDIEKIEEEILRAAQMLVKDNKDIGAIVLECTDMPPYADKIQKLTGLPVFDLTTLTAMVYSVVTQSPYTGIMPGI